MANRPSKQLVKRAMVVLFITCIIGFGTGFAGLIRVQLIHGEEYREKAETQQLSDKAINAQRGTIYDCNMKVLAKSANVWKIYLNPSKIKNEKQKADISKKLAELLEMDYDKVYKKASYSKYGYVAVKNQVENDVKIKVADYIQKNDYTQIIGIDPDTKRYYPYGDFASTVLGFVGSDGTGRSGLEYYYNDILTGEPGRIITAKNANLDDMPANYETVYDAKQGTNLVLTIDEVIQYYLDKGLEQGVKDAKASYGYGIVMNVKTGAILAMSTQPDFDANDPYTIADETTKGTIDAITDEKAKQDATTTAQYSQWRNRAISDSYEPGSVFKLVTASASLEEGVVKPTDMFYCSGNIKIVDRTIHCAEREGHGSENFKEGLMNSCNPVFVEVGQRLGSSNFSKYFNAFGFTGSTGLDLPAEATPVANVTYHTKLSISDLASSSFGQSFQVTPIQMLTAVSAIANGGKLMQPYIVSSTLDEDGNTISETKPTVKRQVISGATSKTMCDMMEGVVTGGTGKNAYVPGYRIAGKTGTSEKLTNKGMYIASFSGFAPANDPEIAVLIIIDEPKSGSYYGGSVAAPIAAEIFENTLKYLNVEPQYSEEELAKLSVTTPNMVNEKLSIAKSKLQNDGFTVKIMGSGDTVVKQSPSADSAIPKNGIIVLYTDKSQATSTTKVPTLTNLSLAEVNRVAIAAGVNIKISGYTSSSDVVSYRQSVAPETDVEMGTVITVSFKSNTNVSDE